MTRPTPRLSLFRSTPRHLLYRTVPTPLPTCGCSPTVETRIKRLLYGIKRERCTILPRQSMAIACPPCRGRAHAPSARPPWPLRFTSTTLGPTVLAAQVERDGRKGNARGETPVEVWRGRIGPFRVRVRIGVGVGVGVYRVGVIGAGAGGIRVLRGAGSACRGGWGGGRRMG